MDLFAGNWMEQLEIAILVGIATVIGAVIGAEREISNKPAASLLLVAALSVAVVVGYVLLAALMTVLSLAILRLLKKFSRHAGQT